MYDIGYVVYMFVLCVQQCTSASCQHERAETYDLRFTPAASWPALTAT
jgi:hypothetical protein